MNIVQLLCLILPFLVACSDGFRLAIMHTNDVHARIEEISKYNGECTKSDSEKGKCYGGMARMHTKIKELRQAYKNTLLLDAGDQFQGTMYFYELGGQVMSHFMNINGYDAMALGNHEFDGGPEGLKPFIENLTAKVVDSNIDASAYPYLSNKITNSTVIEKDGTKIGIVGYTTKETPSISSAGKVKFFDEIESIRQEVGNLNAKGVNIIIVVGHGGFELDKEIAKRVPLVDIVIGGHTNTFLYNGEAPFIEKPIDSYPKVVSGDDCKDVLVVQDFAFGKYLGFLVVEFSQSGQVMAWNGNPILLDKSVPKDPEVMEIINRYSPRVNKAKNTVVGIAKNMLNAARSNCRVNECIMGNLVADAWADQYNQRATKSGGDKVYIVVLNSGGLRSSIPKGKITIANVISAMPFKNTVDMVEVTGAVIREVLERSASKYNPSDGNGGFLQVGGMTVTFDMKLRVGQRVTDVTVRCSKCATEEKLDDKKKYKMLVPTYLVNGGDGYTMIKNGATKYVIGHLDTALLRDYIKEKGTIVGKLDGRIKFASDISEE